MRPTVRCYGVCALATVAALALAAPDAHAQRRRHHGSSNSNSEPAPPPPPPPSTGSTQATQPSSQGSSAPPASRASASTSSGAAAPARAAGRGNAAASEVMVSNVINRPGYHQTRVNLELNVGIGPGAWGWPWGGIVPSAGLRIGIPLTRNGMHGALNNDVRLMFGAQGYVAILPPYTYWWINAPVALQWNFYLSEQWSVLLEAGLSVDVFLYDHFNCYDHPRLYCDRVFFHPHGAIGLRRHLSGANAPPGLPAFAFRFSYPAGVQLAFEF